MGLAETVSEFIGLVYESPHDARTWDRMAHRLVDLTHSHGMLISVFDPEDTRFEFTRLYGPESSSFADGVAEYDAEMYRMDPSLPFVTNKPNATYFDSERVLGSDGYLSHPFVRWTRHRFGVTHWMLACTPQLEGLRIGVSMHTPASQGHMAEEDERLFRAVYPHIRRAIYLAARPPRLSDDRLALILVDGLGQVVELNARARRLAESADGFRIEARSIVPSAAGTAAGFASLMRAALRPDIAEASSGAVRFPRQSGRKDLLVLVEPLPRGEPPAAFYQAAALVRIVDPADHPRIGPLHSSLFNLTEREAEVAGLLLTGHSTESVANALGINRTTVRVHLRSLFRKTETSRQSELLDLLLRVA